MCEETNKDEKKVSSKSVAKEYHNMIDSLCWEFLQHKEENYEGKKI